MPDVNEEDRLGLLGVGQEMLICSQYVLASDFMLVSDSPDICKCELFLKGYVIPSAGPFPYESIHLMLNLVGICQPLQIKAVKVIRAAQVVLYDDLGTKVSLLHIQGTTSLYCSKAANGLIYI